MGNFPSTAPTNASLTLSNGDIVAKWMLEFTSEEKKTFHVLQPIFENVANFLAHVDRDRVKLEQLGVY